MRHTTKEYGPLLLRVALGLLFLIPGLSKLMNPSTIANMLAGMGFPAAAFFGWLVIIAEVVFGIALLIGYKVEWAVWPNFVVLFVATLMVALPGVLNGAPMAVPGLLFHITGLAGLISLYFSGPGAWSIEGKL